MSEKPRPDFNLQPDPPAAVSADRDSDARLNPQPEPPGAARPADRGSDADFNLQPDPPAAVPADRDSDADAPYSGTSDPL